MAALLMLSKTDNTWPYLTLEIRLRSVPSRSETCLHALYLTVRQSLGAFLEMCSRRRKHTPIQR
jgi:hypothetical protein